MSVDTAIEWTKSARRRGATWNTMIGCTRRRYKNADGTQHPSGCDKCYADDQVARFEGRYDRLTTIKLGPAKRGTLTFTPTDPTTGKSLGMGAQWTGAVWLLPDVLLEPLRRKHPTIWFGNSLSDWAHESVIGSEVGRRFVAAMWAVMALSLRADHIFQWLTKRPDLALQWFAWLEQAAMPSEATRQMHEANPPTPSTALRGRNARIYRFLFACLREFVGDAEYEKVIGRRKFAEFGITADELVWPLPNVWLGGSISDQLTADLIIPRVLELPTPLPFASYEPALGPLDVTQWLTVESIATVPVFDVEAAVYRDQPVPMHNTEPGERRFVVGDRHTIPRVIWARKPRLEWVIVGGESGSGARRCDVEWLHAVVKQCRYDTPIPVPVFVKQLGRRPFSGGIGLGAVLEDAKGGDMSEWPEHLRVRQMPEAA